MRRGVLLISCVICWSLGLSQMPFGQQPKLVVQLGHVSDVTGLVFSSDGRLLASCGRDDTVKLRDVATGRELRTFPRQNDAQSSVAFLLQDVLAGRSPKPEAGQELEKIDRRQPTMGIVAVSNLHAEAASRSGRTDRRTATVTVEVADNTGELALGVNRYADRRYDLNYAAPDVLDIGAAAPKG